MDKFGLEEKYIKFLENILKENIKDDSAKFYIFGSRSKGNFAQYSDIDIAIKSDMLSDEIKTKIELEFENSTLPYEVDIIDLNDISDKFKEFIKDDLKELFV